MHLPADRSLQDSAGFTLFEVMVVLAIAVALVMISIPVYTNYSDRARSSEIIMRYDALQSGLTGLIGTEPLNDCRDVAGMVTEVNLGMDYARLSLGFEAASGNGGGYRPVMLVCARNDAQGDGAVRVAQAAFEELSANVTVEAGAVVSPVLVSFAVPLTPGNAAICRVPYGDPLTACGDPRAVPTPATLRAPQQVAATPIAAPPLPVQSIPQCSVPVNQMIERTVMNFGGGAQSYIVNDGDLNTGGDMRAFTAEITLMGGAQVAANAGHGATIFSYASQADNNELSIWNPESVTVSFGTENINTGVNINDGQSHRLTVSWESGTGAVVVYDNGVEAFRGQGHRGGVVRGNGKLALGGDQDSYGGGFSQEDSFNGKIVTASLANVVVPSGNINAGPIHTTVTTSNGLITNILATPQGFTDTTGQYQYRGGPGLTAVRKMVPSGLYVNADCS